MSQIPNPSDFSAAAKTAVEDLKKALAEAGVSLPMILQSSVDATSGQLLESTTTLAEMNNTRPADVAKMKYLRGGIDKLKAMMERAGISPDLNVGKTIPWMDGRDHRG